MINRIKLLVEKITGLELDTIMNYSKSTPQYMLDKLISELKAKRVDLIVQEERPDYYLIRLIRGGSVIKDRHKLLKNELLHDNIDIDELTFAGY